MRRRSKGLGNQQRGFVNGRDHPECVKSEMNGLGRNYLIAIARRSASVAPSGFVGNADVHADRVNARGDPAVVDANGHRACNPGSPNQLRQSGDLVPRRNQGSLELLVLGLEELIRGLQLLKPGLLPLPTFESGYK